MMAQVTIEAPFTEKSHDHVSQSLHTSSLLLPHLAMSPGQDGYRTPTIEDFHQHARRTRPNRRPGGPSTTSSFVRLPVSAMFGGHTLNQSNISLGNGISEKLEWRERIRHYTWTYFTMTMATGGVANVLYAGCDHWFQKKLFVSKRLTAL